MPEVNSQHALAIGKKLRSVRKKQKMSLRDLAHRAEISASMLSQIETGKAYPSVRSIYNIAAALAVPVDYFFPDRVNPASAGLHTERGLADMTASDLREARLNQDAAVDTAVFDASLESSLPVVDGGARPTIALKGGITWARLTAQAEHAAEFLEITYEPGARSGANMSHHQGREFGLILEGELVVELGFEAYTLKTGDSIVFDSTTPHRLKNESAQPARAIWVVLG